MPTIENNRPTVCACGQQELPGRGVNTLTTPTHLHTADSCTPRVLPYPTSPKRSVRKVYAALIAQLDCGHTIESHKNIAFDEMHPCDDCAEKRAAELRKGGAVIAGDESRDTGEP